MCQLWFLCMLDIFWLISRHSLHMLQYGHRALRPHTSSCPFRLCTVYQSHHFHFLLDQGNLLRGIVNWSGAACTDGQVCQMDQINSVSNIFSLFQIENPPLFTNNIGPLSFPFGNYFFEIIMYQKDCNLEPFCFLTRSVLLRKEHE